MYWHDVLVGSVCESGLSYFLCFAVPFLRKCRVPVLDTHVQANAPMNCSECKHTQLLFFVACFHYLSLSRLVAHWIDLICQNRPEGDSVFGLETLWAFPSSLLPLILRCLRQPSMYWPRHTRLWHSVLVGTVCESELLHIALVFILIASVGASDLQ